jgi:hypothetical protein
MHLTNAGSQNMTGPGRPGREDQASLTALAAAQLGWDYPQLLLEVLSTAVPLSRMRELKPEPSTRGFAYSRSLQSTSF